MTGDWTGPCPLPLHSSTLDAGGEGCARSDLDRTRHARVCAALRRETADGAGVHAPRPLHGRPFRILHGDSGAGWRCAVCGGGSPVEFLRRLFALPEHQSDAAAWSLAARLAGVEPASVDARAWISWDADRAHVEWGAALMFTRANLKALRPLYRLSFPAWEDSDMLSFPATGRGTYLAAYRVRGRLTQLEEAAFPAWPKATIPGIGKPLHAAPSPHPPERVLRFHHWSTGRPARLPRSVTGVWPDTLRLAALQLQPFVGGEASTDAAHVFHGAENAASARHLLGGNIIGAAAGPLGFSHADVDSLAAFARVYVWADHDPRGRSFQYFVVRLLRACGIRTDSVRWAGCGNFPRGYDVNRLIREGGVISFDHEGNPRPHISSLCHRRFEGTAAETA